MSTCSSVRALLSVRSMDSEERISKETLMGTELIRKVMNLAEDEIVIRDTDDQTKLQIEIDGVFMNLGKYFYPTRENDESNVFLEEMNQMGYLVEGPLLDQSEEDQSGAVVVHFKGDKLTFDYGQQIDEKEMWNLLDEQFPIAGYYIPDPSATQVCIEDLRAFINCDLFDGHEEEHKRSSGFDLVEYTRTQIIYYLDGELPLDERYTADEFGQEVRKHFTRESFAYFLNTFGWLIKGGTLVALMDHGNLHVDFELDERITYTYLAFKPKNDAREIQEKVVDMKDLSRAFVRNIEALEGEKFSEILAQYPFIVRVLQNAEYELHEKANETILRKMLPNTW